MQRSRSSPEGEEYECILLALLGVARPMFLIDVCVWVAWTVHCGCSVHAWSAWVAAKGGRVRAQASTLVAASAAAAVPLAAAAAVVAAG